MQNLPYNRGGSHSPEWYQTWFLIWHQTWHWSASSSWATGDLWTGTACRANHCSPISSFSPKSPLPQRQRSPRAKWLEQRLRCCLIGLVLPRRELLRALVVKRILIPTPLSLWSCDPETGPSTGHSLLDTHHTDRERWMVDHSTLPGGIGMEDVPSPKIFSREPQLLGSEEGGDSHPGNGPSELCFSFGNAPGSVMLGSSGALPMSGTPYGGRLSPKIGDVRCSRKGLHGSSSCLYSLLPYSRSGGRTGCTDTQGDLHFTARGGHLFRGRTKPCMEPIPRKTTRICPLTGSSNSCQRRKGYTPRSTTGSLLPEVTTGNHIPWKSSQGGALWIPILGDNTGFIATNPVWAFQIIWLTF